MKLISLDTEDDSKGNVEIINFFDGKAHHTFENIEGAEKYIVSHKGKVEIWAVNLQYDLTNLFYNRPGLCRMNYVGSRLISAQIEGTKIYFKDTLNHWKISVAEMGKKIGLEKLEESLFDGTKKPSKAELIKRCHRDSEITYFFVKKMQEKYKSIGAKLKSTIGATALDHFCTHSDYTKPNKNPFSFEELVFMREGMHGGRTEAFFNKPIKGMIRAYDFNSLYPSVLAENEYPILEERYFTNKPDLSLEGVIHAKVRATRNLWCPYLPCRSDRGLLFPIGTFKGHWTYFEIREALKYGYKLEKVYKALEFSGGTYNPFREWILGHYQRRLEAQKIGDDLESDSCKLIMNNLFGKFSQGNEKTELLPITKNRLKKHSGVILENKYILCNFQSHDWPSHTNYIWSMYCLAYARDKLFKAIQSISNCSSRFLYCDTDSLFIAGNEADFVSSKKLGELKLEGEFEEAYFKGLKNYRLTYTKEWYDKKTGIKDAEKEKRTIYKVRGVPRRYANLFFESGYVEYRKPFRLREALRRNSGKKKIIPIIPNYWEKIHKEDKKIYDKRKVLKNGQTKPIELNE